MDKEKKQSNEQQNSDRLFFVKHKIESDGLRAELSDRRSEKKPRLDDSEIENHLKEIYSDPADGSQPDFKTIKARPKRSPWLKAGISVLIIAALVVGMILAFRYVKNRQDGASVLKIILTAPDKVVLGEDFFYEIEYKNISHYNLNNVTLQAFYPDNFILAEVYSVEPTIDNNFWHLDQLGSNLGGKIKIRGKIINQEGSNNLFTLKANYGISGLSSDFSKESLNSVMVASLPFQISENYYTTALVGEEYPLNINLKNFSGVKIDRFIVSFQGPEEIFSIKKLEQAATSSDSFILSRIDDRNFLVETNGSDLLSLNFRYKLDERRNEQEKISWTFKYLDVAEQEFNFLEKSVLLEVIKSDLNLNLTVNDSASDQPVNFGDTLSYVISYTNKGDKNMKDVVIMVVLKSDFLDWASLKDANQGRFSRQTISWTAKEIPALAELEPGESGEIKFSIKTVNFKGYKFGQDLAVSSYAQFSLGNIEDFNQDDDHINDNSSQTVVNRLNSDLSIKEEALYFDDNNIPVGSGPLPPAIGERTSFRYYWTLKNSLHELRDLKVELDLPGYVLWDGDFSASAGSLDYDPLEHRVIFTISRWPVGVEEVKAAFNISVIPTEAEYNRIIILSSGSALSALDVETGDLINRSTEVKTSKLEDDSIAGLSSDGRVR